MPSKKRLIVNSSQTPGVESIDLPAWDRHGNLVQKEKARPIKEKIDDIEEANVKVPTIKEVEAIRETAYNEGFEQGYESGLTQGQHAGKETGHQEGLERGLVEGQTQGLEQGQAQALAAGKEETAQKLAVLKTVQNAFQNIIKTEQNDIQSALIVLVTKISRQVIQDELRSSPDLVANVIHAAVQSLPNPDENLTIKINPGDLEVVEQFAESHWQIDTTDRITKGGCEVKSGFSFIDFTLEHRFDNAVSQLLTLGEIQSSDTLTQPISETDLLHSEPLASLNEITSDAIDQESEEKSDKTDSEATDETVSVTLSELTVDESGELVEPAFEQNQEQPAHEDPDQTNDGFSNTISEDSSEELGDELGDEKKAETPPDSLTELPTDMHLESAEPSPESGSETILEKELEPASNSTQAISEIETNQTHEQGDTDDQNPVK